VIKNVQWSSFAVPVILVGFYSNLYVFDRFSKNTQKLKLMKISPVGAELFHADGRTVTKLIVTFHSFSKAPTKILLVRKFKIVDFVKWIGSTPSHPVRMQCTSFFISKTRKG